MHAINSFSNSWMVLEEITQEQYRFLLEKESQCKTLLIGCKEMCPRWSKGADMYLISFLQYNVSFLLYNNKTMTPLLSCQTIDIAY